MEHIGFIGCVSGGAYLDIYTGNESKLNLGVMHSSLQRTLWQSNLAVGNPPWTYPLDYL
jgi:hypothetical protein